MKIAQIGSIWMDTPPQKYGGTERIVSSLTEGLVEKGHDVTLFATTSSKTRAKLVSDYPKGLYDEGVEWTNLMYPLLHITAAFDRQAEFDIIHMHLNKASDYLALPLSASIKSKVVFTLHFPYPGSPERKDRDKVLQKYRDLNYVSISQAARTGGENLHWVATVYNGLEISDFTFHENPRDYFVWVGKFNPDKGTDKAIEAAKKAGVKLILAGKIDTLEKADFAFYQEKIKPQIDGKQIMYVGEVGVAEKNTLFGEAIAFLNPIIWNEPFGLVMAESLATGTPVISFKRGAAPEIISNEETGYLVDSVDEMVEKMKYVRVLQRKVCRQRFEKFFTAEGMVESYEKVYRTLIN